MLYLVRLFLGRGYDICLFASLELNDDTAVRAVAPCVTHSLEVFGRRFLTAHAVALITAHIKRASRNTATLTVCFFASLPSASLVYFLPIVCVCLHSTVFRLGR